ncbi:MAG TPA: NAD-dependent epimerase/dehydratase family protein [Candidatus Nanoarchaeia archaeon]|nr:NAD-dependent epimerase/dehydratase family protein [Candidatus Nanoarchaeia archaeon]
MKLAGRTVLVTGGAGFIGSHLVDALLDRGCRVRILDDLSNGRKANISSALQHGAEFLQGSVEDSDIVAQAMRDVSVVFHEAALNLVLSTQDPRRDASVNISGTLNILETARAMGTTDAIVHASTGSVYGEPIVQPQSENHPLNPCSPYGVSKLAAEKYVLLWQKLYQVNTIALRYYNIFGPRKNYHEEHGCVVSIFVKRALEGKPLIIHDDGMQERHFTYVTDVVRANILAAETPSAYGDVYNIGTVEKITIRELARQVNEICGSHIPPVFGPRRLGDIKSMSPDLQKAQAALGYRSTVPIRTGIELLREWMRAELKL